MRRYLLIALAAAPLVVKNVAAQNAILELDARARSAVLDSLAVQLRRYYVRPAVADSLIEALQRRNRAGAFDRARTPSALADRLSAEIHDVVHDDAHLTVRYTPPTPAEAASAPPRSFAEAQALQRRKTEEFVREAREDSFGIPEVRTLDGNVGYLRIGEFLYQTAIGREPLSLPAVIAAMQLVVDRDALILDLRGNRGGHTTVPPVLLSYFFDRPTQLGTSRSRDGQTSESWTPADVPPLRFGGTKPLFVLTSDSTFSAGEGIAAALKATGRATVVGARTRGGASSGDFHSIGAGLRAFIPDEQYFDMNGRSLESIGVTPNVPVPPARALDVAYALALETLAKAESDSSRRARLQGLVRLARGRQMRDNS